MTRRILEKVPMISMEPNLPDLSSLQMNTQNVTFSVKEHRERYAKFALALIYPFRNLDDLKCNQTGLYWDKFVMLRDSHLLSKSGLKILQNLQDQIQCRKLKSFKDVLTRQTKEPHSDEDLRQQKGLDDDNDIGMNMEQISALIEAEQFACALNNIENENGMNGRTFKVISEKRNLATSMLVSSDSQPDSVFTSNNERNYDENIEEDENDIDNKRQKKPKIQSIIEFVTGALLLDFGVECNHNEEPDLIEECRSDIIPMREYAKMHKLDTKQRTVFQVICCSFMLDCIEKISLHNGLGINDLSGEIICKKNKKITVNSFKFKVKRRYNKSG